MPRPKSRYLVRFTLYHYNSGAADNGSYKYCKKFHTQDEAWKFYGMVDALAKAIEPEEHEKARDFAQQYCWDGYVVSADGVFLRTETRLDIPAAPPASSESEEG